MARDTTASYTYGQSADSNFDVGVSIAGGSWQLSGSYHVGNSGGSAVGWTRPLPGQTSYGHRLQSQFHNIKRKISYVYHYYPPCPNDYDTFPQSWNTGAIDGQDNSSNDYHCSTSPYWVNYGAGTSFDRSTNKAYHFGSAVNLFGVIWIGVDSGYSQYAHAKWNFGTGQSTHYLCGNDGFPNVAHRIFAGWS